MPGGRHSRRFLSGNPESLLFVACSPGQLKHAPAHERGTLDSVSVRNIVATLPYSSTARNDGPGHFPHGKADFRAGAGGSDGYSSTI